MTAPAEKAPSAGSAPIAAARASRREQPLAIRIAHWGNALFLFLMAGSGLQILSAYPALGPRGAQYSWYPLQDTAPPEWLTIGGWLAGGRHWHFAIAWLFVLNGLFYLSYQFASGEWRRRFFRPYRDSLNAVHQFAWYLRLRRNPPPLDFYNGLQRLAYNSVVLFGVLMVWSGLAIYKPVQLHLLTVPFGGYDGARAVHLAGLMLLALFVVAHLALVMAHPRELAKMITGGRRG